MAGLLKTIETPAGQTIGIVRENGQIEDVQIVPVLSAGFSPIQNVRWLDELFTGTSTGSIAEPFTLFSQFYAGLGVVSQGWELTLPGLLVTPDAPVPDVTTVSAITFQGIDRRTSQLAALAIANQTGNPSFVFRQLGIAAPGQLQIGDGTLNLDFWDVDIGTAIPTGTALVGTVRIVDSHFTFAIFAGASGSTFTPAPSLEMYGGDITGQASFSTGQFYDVVFGNNVIITPVTNGTTRFVGCRFGTAVTISNAAGPAIEMDTYSHASFVAGGGVFAGTIVVVGTPKETLSIVVPAVLAGQVGYVTTAFAGALAGLPQDTPIVANPTADLVAAGAGGGFINARVSVAGSVRCAFLGPLAGGASNFTFASLG